MVLSSTMKQEQAWFSETMRSQLYSVCASNYFFCNDGLEYELLAIQGGISLALQCCSHLLDIESDCLEAVMMIKIREGNKLNTLFWLRISKEAWRNEILVFLIFVIAKINLVISWQILGDPNATLFVWLGSAPWHFRNF